MTTIWSMFEKDTDKGYSVETSNTTVCKSCRNQLKYQLTLNVEKVAEDIKPRYKD